MGPDRPGAWHKIARQFRDGHTQTWWAVDAALGGWGPRRRVRLVVATTDPGTLPENSTWYLLTNRPRPGSPCEADSPHPAADLVEVVRCYGLRMWVEQSYKQVKDELGWADFQVRSDIAIRRHQTLVHCAFSFCWNTVRAGYPASVQAPEQTDQVNSGERGLCQRRADPAVQLAHGVAHGAGLVDSLGHAATLLAGLVTTTTAP